MGRTTITADDELLARLRDIAHREGVSLSQVIREGLEWRADQSRPRLSCIGVGDSGRRNVSETSERSPFEPRTVHSKAPSERELRRLRARAEQRARERGYAC